jgi:hypothetical protein
MTDPGVSNLDTSPVGVMGNRRRLAMAALQAGASIEAPDDLLVADPAPSER